MRLRTALILGALAVGLFAMPAGSALGQEATKTYVVQMLADPVVAYEGGVAGLPATKPGKGNKIDRNSSNVQRYAEHLKGNHDEALGTVGGGQKLYDFVYTYNGFAAQLTDAQAEALALAKNVVAVTPDELQTMDTSTTPAFLGLTAKGGLWDQLGGVSKGGLNKGAGEDMILGIIDSGVWPDSKSFSDRKLDGSNGNLYPHKVTGFHGTCQTGEAFATSNCNDKLIGARYFNAAWGGNAALEAQRPWEFMSPRDYNGHGTHTSSTAGGNYGVTATGPAAEFGSISGMAPRARISAYKALWSTVDGATASGFTSDLVAAIDQAVADGVDAINYSISGTLTNFLDPVEVSFLFAADAGVFVSASAGNSGPASGTVAHPSPWITTVAAGTHSRSVSGSVTLGNGATYAGASVAATSAGPASFVDSTAVGLPGASATALALCFSSASNAGVAVLDPAKVAGKIVLCDRGVNARVDKSLAVQQAGGIGMVLVNTSLNSLNADFHSIPSVHLSHLDRPAVKAYAATAGATATINKAVFNFATPAPFTASFSSRGPLTAGAGDLLKPDVIAPGQDIIAAVAKTPAQQNLDFNVLSGTSMSAPHVAGLGALLKQLHPSWSPMAVKSALMTSGSDVLDGPNTDPLVIFRQGAGHVRPNSAADPGLVFDSNANDWLAFLCGTTAGVSASTCNALKAAGYSTDPSDLNVASIAIGDLPGSQTVIRKVTNVGKSAATYNWSVSGVAGLSVAVSPSSFTINPGQTVKLEITINNQSAAIGAYVGGQLRLSDGTHSVRVPLVVRPVSLGVPREVSGTGAPISYPVKFGYTGPFSATARGLIPAAVTAGTVPDDPANGACSLANTPDKVKVPVVVPAGTTYARFQLFDADVAPGSDIDMCVFKGTVAVGSSGGGTSAEQVNLVNPAAGNDYVVVVHGWGVPGSSPFKLHTWVLGTTDEGNMTVSAPASAVIGTTGTITLTFSGLTAGTKYLGSVAYSGGGTLPDPTIVRVDP
jgi:subtilisin family serine protease